MDATREGWIVRFLATSADGYGLTWFVQPTGLRDGGERVHFNLPDGCVLEFEWMSQPAAVAADHAAAFVFEGAYPAPTREPTREEWIARFLALSEDEYGLVWRAETGCRDTEDRAAHAVAKPLPVRTGRALRDPLSRDESCVHFFLTGRCAPWFSVLDGSAGLALNWQDLDAAAAARSAADKARAHLEEMRRRRWRKAF